MLINTLAQYEKLLEEGLIDFFKGFIGRIRDGQPLKITESNHP